MALIVEDGSIVAGAESLVSVAEATTYHSNRGNSEWAALASDTVREQALRKATDYIGQVYRARWAGSRVSSIQTLDWPRAYVPRDDLKGASIENLDFNGGIYFYPNDEVPTEVKNACAELALRASTDDLLPDLTQAIIREKVDVLETEYDKYSSQLPRYSAIDRLLMPFLRGSSASRTVVRA
jgi:hypothetical protein